MTKHTLISALVFVAVGFAAAADSVWVNASSGLFSDPLNWSAGVPGASDSAVFDAGTYTVQSAGTLSTAGARFTAGSSADLELGGVWTTGTLTLKSTFAQPAKVVLRQGEISVNSSIRSYFGGSNTTDCASELIITNATLRTGSGEVYCGGYGPSNAIIVRAGGNWTGSGKIVLGGSWPYTAAGEKVIVDGAGASVDFTNWFVLGYFAGYEQFHVRNGAKARIAALTMADAGPSPNNLIKVDGAGSDLLVSGNLKAGQGGGTNLLQITNGGRLIADSQVIIGGFDCGYLVENGGVATNKNVAYIGNSGDRNWLKVDNASMYALSITLGNLSTRSNSVEVVNGGKLFAGSWGWVLVAGGSAGANGNRIRVSGAGSRIDSYGIVTVGNNGSRLNTLTVSDGGRLETASNIYCGGSGSPAANVNNSMVVSNGIVRAAILSVQYTNTLSFAGASNDVLLTEFKLENDGTARFNVADAAYQSIRTTHFYGSGGSIAVDARLLQRKGGGKNICLVKYSNTFNAPKSIVCEPVGCTVTNDATAKMLLLSVPNGLPTRINLF